jgi:hypothetical protein
MLVVWAPKRTSSGRHALIPRSFQYLGEVFGSANLVAPWMRDLPEVGVPF